MSVAHEGIGSAERVGLEAYRRAVSASFVPLAIASERPSGFSGALSSVMAGEVAFTEVASTPQRVERTPETIAAGGSGYYKVSLLLCGSSLLVQDGREVTMHPGDLTFYDTSRPYSLLFDGDFRNLIMMFPKRLIEYPASASDALTAVSLGAEHRLAGLTAEFIARSAPELHHLGGSARARLARTGVDLMNTMISAILGSETRGTSREPSPLDGVLRFMTEHLSSPALSPATIAAANFISVRHLHAVFRREGTTVSRWIKERRMERCRVDLADPALAHLSIASIAARWGITDPAYFSRVFRAAYGMSPRECRGPRVGDGRTTHPVSAPRP